MVASKLLVPSGVVLCRQASLFWSRTSNGREWKWIT